MFGQVGSGVLRTFGWAMLLSAVLLVSCSSARRGDACPDAPGPIVGSIVFGAQNNLLAMADDGGEPPMQLTHVSAGHFAYEPAWSPDGQTLAFTLAQPAQDPALSWLPIGVICGIDRETGQGRLLARGATPIESFTEAAWSGDGRDLLLSRHKPQLDANGQFRGDKLTIIQYDLESQTSKPLIVDGYSPALAPDAARLAYLKVNPEVVGVDLMLSAVDGSQAQSVPTDVAKLSSMVGPRWSPDGTRLLFTASDDDGRQLAPPASAGPSLFDLLLGVQVAQAHGTPADLWITDTMGQTLQRVTNKGLDDPRAAWSPDGRRVAYTLGTGGVVVLDLATGQEAVLTDKGDYGGISWAAR